MTASPACVVTALHLPFKTNKTMKQTIILLIAIIASSITLGVSCTNSNKTDRNISVIDSLKHEIIIRDSIINIAIDIMDNNQLWYKDGSDRMSKFLSNLEQIDITKMANSVSIDILNVLDNSYINEEVGEY